MGEGEFDAVVVGAGHNGLTCAAYLARAGRRVLVLEGMETIGGMSGSEELAAPGFLSDVHASGYLVAKLGTAPDELGLAGHGLRLITPDPNWAQVFPDGRKLLIGRDPQATARSIATFSTKDAETWLRIYGAYQAARSEILGSLFSPPRPLAETLAAKGGADGYRAQLQSGRSWAEETFESPEVRLFFTSAGLHAGLAPDDALGGQFAWLFASAIQDVGCSLVAGGMRHVTAALAEVVHAHGGEVRTGARVAAIEAAGGRATGVRLADGARITVDGPIAVNADPRTLVVDLLGAAAGPGLAARIAGYDWGPSFFAIYLALDAPVPWKAGPEVAGVSYVHASESSIDVLAGNFVEIRAGRAPARPMLGIINEASVDLSRAPAGKSLVKLVVHFVPWDLAGPDGRRDPAHWDAAKEGYADALLAWVDAAFLPGLRSRIVGRAVHSPLDLQRATPSSVHGTHQHGAFLPWQVGAFRPLPELGQYRAPVAGVYLCGAGSHPGSGISMGPGRNAAAAICADLGLAFPS
ncbi:MAG: NAD(P)/FAD-dependent oxidoreductase [Amaricoccus sp.]